jgi:hypothetical protein
MTDEKNPKSFFQEDEYNNRWKEVNGTLFFYTQDFSYRPNVILLDLDDCLVKREPGTFFYRRNNPTLSFFSDDFIRALRDLSEENSLVIMTQTLSGLLKVDILKKKVKVVADSLPVLCFATKNPDGNMKPHTGFFRVVRDFFSRKNVEIRKVKVISNQGGIMQENTLITLDTDRAFAHNIGVRFPNINTEFSTILEFLGDPVPKLAWDPSVVKPEIRGQLLFELERREKTSVIEVMEKKFGFGHDVYAIFVMGPPSSGKTKFIKDEKKSLAREKRFSSNHATRVLKKTGPKSRFSEFQNLLRERFSVIVDGHCQTFGKRKLYFDLLRKKKIPTIFVNICTGIHVSKLLNHVAAEMNAETPIKKFNDFRIYASEAILPSDEEEWLTVHNHYPKIEFINEDHKRVFLECRF